LPRQRRSVAQRGIKRYYRFVPTGTPSELITFTLPDFVRVKHIPHSRSETAAKASNGLKWLREIVSPATVAIDLIQ